MASFLLFGSVFSGRIDKRMAVRRRTLVRLAKWADMATSTCTIFCPTALIVYMILTCYLAVVTGTDGLQIASPRR